MMWNAVGVHDPDNSLVMWAVRTDSDKTADGSSETGPTSDWTRHDVDDRLSTETNDLIIAFNYKTGSFSTHRMPAGNDIVDLERMPDADGNWRIFALEEALLTLLFSCLSRSWHKADKKTGAGGIPNT